MLNGIDISSWQASISISDVPGDFVIVKGTEGTSYTSPNMEDQADQTLACGKLLGLYHFARTGDAYSEADYFVDHAASLYSDAALFLDYESDALNNGTGWAYNFLRRVQERTGKIPGVYMSKSVCRSQDWSSVAEAGYPLWVAQYANNNRMGYTDSPWADSNGYGAWEGPAIFQYTSSGQLNGYSGNLDLNLFYGDEDTWNQLFYGGDNMNFDDVWFGETFNQEKTPATESNTTPANLLWETAGEVHDNKTKLAEIEAKLENLKISGASVDYDKLATLVCDKLAKRLEA